MGLAQETKSVNLSSPSMVFRPSQVYLTATGAYTLFNIANGAIEILSLVARQTALRGGAAATTVRVTVNAVNTDSGAVDISTVNVIGTIFWSGLNVGALGTWAAAAPVTIATYTTMLAGHGPAAAGTVIATFAAGGTSVTLEWCMIYRKLSPYVRVWVT